jgi:3-hydroxyisobutyrate dehydrogenase-like beta-hydroxyacid dehydrogenase
VRRERDRVGIVGLGSIGGGLARALRRGGWAVVAHDTLPAAAGLDGLVTVVASPALVARQSDTVFVAVVNEAQCRDVLFADDGLLVGADRGLIVVVVATVPVTSVHALADQAGLAGVVVVDCAVVGGASVAAAGELVALVGADDDTFERLRPVLDTAASLVLHMGERGAGMSAKLAYQVASYGTLLATWEASLIAELAGVDLGLFVQAVDAGIANAGGLTALVRQRWTAGPLRDAVAIGAFTHIASLAAKDLAAAQELALSVGARVRGLEVTAAHIDEVLGLPGEPH